MAFWDRVTALIAGGAVARAASDAATPVLEPVRQHAWLQNKLRVLDPGTAARLVAQAIIAEGEAASEAGRNGFSENRLRALIHLAQVAPGLADARALRRRKKITTDDLHHVYAKEQIEPQFWDDLDVLLGVLLSPAEVANAIQQGHLANPGVLPDVSPAVKPAQGSVIPQAPDQQPPSHVPLTQIDLDPLEQAEGSGTSFEQLQVLANLSGLPPGADTLLQMWNRQLIDEESVDAGIREGHLKTKWAGAFKRMRWAVLSASEYANLHIRGWIDVDAMYKGGALTGHTTDQMDLLYLNRGRPLAPQQAATAWARDAPHPVGPGYPDRPGTFDEEDFLRALKQSDVRTEYGPILWHNRFAYPSLFQLNRLVQAHAITADVGADWARKDRYAPEVVAALVAYWGTLGAGTSKELVKSELIDEFEGGFLSPTELRDHLTALGFSGAELDLEVHLADARRIKAWRDKGITALNKSFLNSQMTIDQAKVILAELGVTDPDTQTRLTDIWTIERGLP